ncbi:hypothetical protein M2282_005934 [Variovorax boronicumulans]|uniref:hypothetical protein n=1 Tax=Variovorax boronicumulans TaxID=436515 RepID=UPI0024767AC4|nr:hypothetical protein [Variovorax boronicumulans]MDH6170756.1 hypothetical protein [Variovorax boronicumulans]
MHDSAVLASDNSPHRFERRLPARSSAAALLQAAQTHQYREMEHAFRATGGLVSSDDIVSLLMSRTDQPISRLARWIVNHDVISFQWQSRTLLPLFQFDLFTVTPHLSVTAVIRELIPALSDWETCLWFLAPNAWLGDTSPLDSILLDAPAVVDAARGERFLLRG